MPCGCRIAILVAVVTSLHVEKEHRLRGGRKRLDVASSRTSSFESKFGPVDSLLRSSEKDACPASRAICVTAFDDELARSWFDIQKVSNPACRNRPTIDFSGNEDSPRAGLRPGQCEGQALNGVRGVGRDLPEQEQFVAQGIQLRRGVARIAEQ